MVREQVLGKILESLPRDVAEIGGAVRKSKGPLFYEIPVNLSSRADLSRPAETARENRESFMHWL